MINYNIPNSVSQFQPSALRLLSFDDLEFQPHGSMEKSVHAVLDFDNGFSISSISKQPHERRTDQWQVMGQTLTKIKR